MILTQTLITGFVIFAASRVVLRFHEGKLSRVALFGWTLVWLAVAVFAWFPQSATSFANALGIGRGTDLVIYISLAAIFYLIFRIYVKFEDLERQITDLVRRIAFSRKPRK